MAVVLLFIIAEPVDAQVVHEAGFHSEADLRVYITDDASLADLVVFRTQHQADARRSVCGGIWYISPFSSQSDFVFIETRYRSQADLELTWTHYRSEAVASSAACDMIRRVIEEE